MMSSTHSLAGGAAAGATTLVLLPGDGAAALAALMFGTVVAGELPDLDVAGSKLSRGRRARGLMRTPLLVLALPAVLLGLVLRPLLKPLGRLGEHRGATHTLVGLALFTLLIPPLYLAAATGCLHLLSHLHPALVQPTADTRHALSAHAPTVLAITATSTLTGVGSHLTLDWMTPSGIALAAPLSTHRFHAPLTVRTGSLGELPVTATMLVLWALVVLHALAT